MIRHIAAAALGILLSGCVIQERVHETNSEANKKGTAYLEEQAAYKEAKAPPAKAIVTEGFWVDTRAIRTPTRFGEELPSVLNKQIKISHSGSPNLLELAALLTKASEGVQIGFTADAQQAVSRGAGGSSNANLVGLIPYEGSFSGALDLMASRNNLFWRWTGTRIEFFLNETRTFTINALAGSSESTASAGGSTGVSSGGGGGGGSDSGSKVSVNSKLSVWDSVRDSVRAMLSTGGKLAVTEATGTITVTDTPTVLNQVGVYVRDLNETISRQVMVTIDVYAVQNKENEDYATNLDAIYQSLSKNLDLFYTGGSVPLNMNAFQAIATSAATGTITPPTLTDPGGTRSSSRSPWTNSKAIFGALSSIGKTSGVYNSTVVTTSGQPVPVRVVKDVVYLASVTQSTVQTGTAPQGPQLTPGKVQSGFTLNLLPRVLENGDVALRYSLDITTLDEINKVSSGLNSIETPSTSSRNFISNIVMRSGQSLVLGGFKQVFSQTTRSGPVNPNAWMLGGENSAASDNAFLVIVMTPRILDRSTR